MVLANHTLILSQIGLDGCKHSVLLEIGGSNYTELEIHKYLILVFAWILESTLMTNNQ